jgi:hypothetical protein
MALPDSYRSRPLFLSRPARCFGCSFAPIPQPVHTVIPGFTQVILLDSLRQYKVYIHTNLHS